MAVRAASLAISDEQAFLDVVGPKLVYLYRSVNRPLGFYPSANFPDRFSLIWPT